MILSHARLPITTLPRRPPGPRHDAAGAVLLYPNWRAFAISGWRDSGASRAVARPNPAPRQIHRDGQAGNRADPVWSGIATYNSNLLRLQYYYNLYTCFVR